jgi:hypothetical protein
MANSPNENLMSELASQMISQIGSFFERINASSSRPIGNFVNENAQNILYVLYSANGLPLFAGVILASDGKRGEARAQREVQTLAGSGYVASYRTVEFGSENMAMQMERLVSDLFGAALPLSARNTRAGATASEPAPARRPGRPRRDAAAAPTAGKRRGRPRRNAAEGNEGAEAAAPRRRGRPRKVENAEGAATAPRKRGRPRKTETAEAAPARRPGRPRKERATESPVEQTATKRRGRPRKAAAEEGAAAPRRRGRPRKEGSTGTRGGRGRGGRKGAAGETASE